MSPLISLRSDTALREIGWREPGLPGQEWSDECPGPDSVVHPVPAAVTRCFRRASALCFDRSVGVSLPWRAAARVEGSRAAVGPRRQDLAPGTALGVAGVDQARLRLPNLIELSSHLNLKTGVLEGQPPGDRSPVGAVASHAPDTPVCGRNQPRSE